jgi:hypothetical protein
VLALILAPGCADGGATSGAASGGSAEVPPFELEHVLTVSGHVVDFASIDAVIADEDGRMYVADSDALEIAVVDEEGRRTGAIGRPGAGPGEFRRLDDIAWAGDLLLALDWPQGSALFHRDGRIAATGEFRGRARSLAFSGPDVGYAQAVIPGSGVEYGLIAPTGSYSILPMLSDSVPVTSVDCGTSDGWTHPLLIPFARRGPMRAFLPGGVLAVGHRDAYRIDLVDIESGDTIRSITRDYPRIPLTRERWERQDVIRQYRELVSERGAAFLESDPSQPCPLDERPEFLPVLLAVVADDAGRLWVESSTDDGFAVTVFDNHEPVGQAPMPVRDETVAPYVRANRLYIVTRDEFDVQSIEVYEARLPE